VVCEGQWWLDWLQSPGFGGVAAVVAAVIAVVAARVSAREQKRHNELTRWWERARYALELIQHDSPEIRLSGYRMLTSAAKDPVAKQVELEFIDAATDAELLEQTQQAATENRESPRRRRFRLGR